MNNNYKLSVIIPIYRTEAYIERCANSLFAQELDSIEFIFVDDCSPDNSISRLETVIENNIEKINTYHWEVKIVKTPCNSGLPLARKYGFEQSTGDFIIHCDSDDWIDSHLYKLMYDKGKENNADVVICDIILTDGQQDLKRIVGCQSVDKDLFIDRMMTQKDHWSLCNKLFRRNCYNLVHFPVGGMGEDMALTLQLILKCKHIEYVCNAGYYYYQNPTSITHLQSKEDILKKYYQLSDNSRIVYDFYSKNLCFDRFETKINWLWFRSSNVLMPYIKDDDIYKLWKSHYFGKHISFLLNRDVSLLRKIRHLLILFRFPFIC